MCFSPFTNVEQPYPFLLIDMEKDDVTAKNSYSHNTRKFEKHGGKHKIQRTSVVIIYLSRKGTKKKRKKSTANMKTVSLYKVHIGLIRFGFRTIISVSQKEW